MNWFSFLVVAYALALFAYGLFHSISGALREMIDGFFGGRGRP